MENKCICPICGGRLNVCGSRHRILILEDGSRQTLIIRRLVCVDCKKIHHELPDIIVPYKRHCAETIEKIIECQGSVCCEESTILRIRAWWVALSQYFAGVLESLKAKHGEVLPERATLKEIVRAVANTNLWPHTRSAFLSEG